MIQMRISSKETSMKRNFTTMVFIVLCFAFGQAQNSSTQSNQNDKAEEIIQKAVKKLGGNRYLNVRTAISRGLYTQYREGQLLQTMSFVDYIVYPDSERTEFKNRGVRSIQTNVGNAGWIFDGMGRTLKDITAEQAKDFRDFTLRTSVETLLRGVWKKENATLEYVGRREATLGRRNEVVRVTYPDGFAVEFEFSFEHLPAKVIYKRKVETEEESSDGSIEKKTDGPNYEKEEIRFAQFVEIDGILAPLVIDTYREGKQSARVNFESIEFNKEVPESLFAKPANVKEIK